MTDREPCAPCSCCTSSPPAEEPWIAGSVTTAAGKVPVIATRLSVRDTLGKWRARVGVGRDRYRVSPGLYAVGSPGPDDIVFVTANYKLSFDALRAQLGGMDAWILVLDTKGINVWCAAGKGTFGTEELVARIQATRLAQVVAHHTLILPQLGASGVAAHEVKRQTGFRVIYGPVQARDLRRFVEAGLTADQQMRRVTFSLGERLTVVPVELVGALRYVPYAALLLAVVVALTPMTLVEGLNALLILAGTVVVAAVGVPAALPWLPSRAFSIKGWSLGVLWALIVAWRSGADALGWISSLLLLPAVTSFLALNFTGSTPITSQNGVNKEIRLFARPMLVTAVLGLISGLAGLW